MGKKEKKINEMDLNQLSSINVDDLNINEMENLLKQFESLVNGTISESINESFNINDDFKFVTKFINKSNNPDPEYAKEGDSGFDLRAFIDEPITLKPLERKLIPTGLSVELSP